MLVIILMVVQIIIYGNSVGLAIGIGSIYLLLQLYDTHTHKKELMHTLARGLLVSHTAVL
jgi:hypothetical protein